MTDDVVDFTLTKELSTLDQGEYVTLPFDVPERVEEVGIQLNVNGSGENVIDLGLEDPHGVRGWSGGARKSAFVREDRATPGYTVGPLSSGRWGVILNAYQVSRGGCSVEVQVTLNLEKHRWFKGDLHMHSNHSDGAYSLSEVITHVKETGLEFMALTDHNTFSQNDAYPMTEDLAIIPAVELTTNRGHSNFYGVKRPFTDFRCQTVEDVQRVIKEGEANGALISVNHPHCDYCWWDWGLDHFDFQFVEIWNGVWSKANQRSLDWWHNQLCKGKRIVAIGGSDKHGQDEWIRYGGPTTWVLAKSHSPRGILEGIRKGHVCVSAHPDEAFIDLKLNQVGMGGTLYTQCDLEEVELTCTVHETAEGIVKIISKQGTVKVFEVDMGKSVFNLTVNARTPFYRAELWGTDRQLKQIAPLAISNAVFIKS